MPLLYKETKNEDFCIGIWEVVEPESYFLENLTLSKNDKKLLNNAKNSQRRIEILSVRLLIKNLGLNIDVNHTPTGKPIVEQGNISISHTNRFSAIIFHRYKNVAIDIEKPSKIIAKSKHLVFNNNEIEFANNNLDILTILWCCKECIVKITGNLKVNFLTHINIHPFFNSSIGCDYIYNNEIKHYNFNHSCIKDHIFVWGTNHD